MVLSGPTTHSIHFRVGGQFSLETCRVIIAMLDTSRTMTMNFEGFKQVHAALESWKECFRRFDVDMSGTCEHGELKAIFHHMQFNVSDAATDICIKRYSKRATGQVRSTLDDPVRCAVARVVDLHDVCCATFTRMR